MLPTGGGTKTVSVWYRDAWGNQTPAETPFTGTILLDTAVPTNGTVSGAVWDRQIALSWAGYDDGAGGSGIEKYTVVYKIGSVPSSCTAGTVLYTGPDTMYDHTGLTNGTLYSYRVCAVDVAGNMSTGAVWSGKPAAP